MNLQEYFKNKQIIYEEEKSSKNIDFLAGLLDEYFPFPEVHKTPKYFTQPRKTKLTSDDLDLLIWAEKVPCPDGPIRLDQCTTIIDCALFVSSSIANIRANGHKGIYRPSIDSLIRYKHLITLKDETI
jgi:hypothetical protein